MRVEAKGNLLAGKAISITIRKDIKMVKKKESKKEPGLEGRVDAVFEIMAQHKLDIELSLIHI